MHKLATEHVLEFAFGSLLVALVCDLRGLRVGVVWNIEEIYDDDTGGHWMQYSVSLCFFPALALRLRVNVETPAPELGRGND